MKLSWVLLLVVLTGLVTYAAPEKTRSIRFREPHSARYLVSEEELAKKRAWIKATPADDLTGEVQIGARIVLQVQDPTLLPNLLNKRPVSIARRINDTVVILQATDAAAAIQQAEEISALPGVVTCHPVMQRSVDLDATYASLPSDPYFSRYQWYFENRLTNGLLNDADLNIRSAWAHTRGAGVTIAIADTGFELDHPELASNSIGTPHFNFETREANGAPPNRFAIHGTAVAGLAAAAQNGIGLVGAAPEATLASWVIIGTNQTLQSRQYLVDDESLFDMFQYRSNIVQVQNHSWGHPGSNLDGPTLLPRIAISNALELGRDGLGTIMVRSGGNGRTSGNNANDSSYRSDPRVIAVAASGYTGRAASYSNPGACLLVSAIGADSGQILFTTDRQNTNGYNTGFLTFDDPNFWDYTTGFAGTSAAAPQISGLVALMLSVNPTLSVRDVQQILVHSARHFDLADPGVATNAAGFLVSHNVGFGIPDAGEAVRLAKTWQTRPALSVVRIVATNETEIPDAGLRVHVTGDNLPINLSSIIANPSRGVHADSPTGTLPLVDVGVAATPIGINLSGKGALILRDAANFQTKITNAANAGAAFAIIYNNSTSPIYSMGGTDFAPIPAVFIPKAEGDMLRDFISTNVAEAKIQLTSAAYSFPVSDTLSCEHVGLRVKSNHPWRGDLRITLTSPTGTRSILQQLNSDINPVPGEWTYYSTHHFYESSAGIWTVAITDQSSGTSGTVQEVELIIHGTSITDSDHDGLDDGWELAHFGSLQYGAMDDPDKDGYNNAREQVLATNPLTPNGPLSVDLSRWNHSYYRASWPGSPHYNYEVWSGTNVANLTLVTNISGRFPETEWVLPSSNASRFIRVVAQPRP